MSVPAGYRERTLLMDAGRMQRTLVRLAAEIAERLPDPSGAVLLGVRTRGVPLARRLAALLERSTGRSPAVGALDITLYRDDLSTLASQPVVRGTDLPRAIDGRSVILVDDVLFTGRTIRAALDELLDYGRPARIQLAVLIDRGHRELPIQADYVGRKVPTARDEAVQVRLSEEDGDDRVVLLAPQDGPPTPSRQGEPARSARRRRKSEAKPKPQRRKGSAPAGASASAISKRRRLPVAAASEGAARRGKAANSRGGERRRLHVAAASGGSGGGGAAPAQLEEAERRRLHVAAASGGSGGRSAAPPSSTR